MKYYLPSFEIATLGNPQKAMQSKVGGLPWGLPHELWPSCCGRPQKLFAQFCHEPPMLDLGDPEAILHIFQCSHCGSIADLPLDAFLFQRKQLGNGLVSSEEPIITDDIEDQLIGEIRITGWTEEDDHIPIDRIDDFYQNYFDLKDDFSDIDWFDSRLRTKFGGSPRWTGNGPMGFPPPPFEFLFQIDNWLWLHGLPPKPDEVGCYVATLKESNGGEPEWIYKKPEKERRLPNAPWGLFQEGDTEFRVEFTNLGSDGTAYVFIDRTQTPHQIKWFWNR